MVSSMIELEKSTQNQTLKNLRMNNKSFLQNRVETVGERKKLHKEKHQAIQSPHIYLYYYQAQLNSK